MWGVGHSPPTHTTENYLSAKRRESVSACDHCRNHALNLVVMVCTRLKFRLVFKVGNERNLLSDHRSFEVRQNLAQVFNLTDATAEGVADEADTLIRESLGLKEVNSVLQSARN